MLLIYLWLHALIAAVNIMPDKANTVSGEIVLAEISGLKKCHYKTVYLETCCMWKHHFSMLLIELPLLLIDFLFLFLLHFFLPLTTLLTGLSICKCRSCLWQQWLQSPPTPLPQQGSYFEMEVWLNAPMGMMNCLSKPSTISLNFHFVQAYFCWCQQRCWIE